MGDATVIAKGLRDVLDQTTILPPAPAKPPAPVDLDTDRINAALGATGTNDNGTFKFTFARNETVADHRRVTPTAMGVSTGLNFQPVGSWRAAINGDFVMTAHEVQNVIIALRAADIQVVELHNHGLDDQPRLFCLHFWKVGDGLHLARGLASAVHATNVHPV
jgi:hypothetical protein